MLKVCKKCKKEKSIKDFAKNGKSTRVYCKNCEAKRARDNYYKTQEYIRFIKDKCVKCGYSKNPAALDFHHPNKNKENNIATLCKRHLSSKQKTLIENEFRKCILLCSNCHREEHNQKYNR